MAKEFVGHLTFNLSNDGFVYAAAVGSGRWIPTTSIRSVWCNFGAMVQRQPREYFARFS
jgi:hypothetical protein